MFAPLLCPVAQMLPSPSNKTALAYESAARSGLDSPEFVGTRCEPWLVRHALTALDHLIEPHHRGLEWSTGSSTLWNLLRLHDLHSVEHDGPWLAAVRAKVAMVLPHVMAARWTSRHVPCVERKLGSCNGMGVHNPYRPTNSYTEYERTPARVFLPAIRAAQPDFPGFDYVVVDGRSRAKCVREATDTPGLLNPAHGILVLDNANSPFHSTNVSSEWLYASFQNLDFDRGARTDVWMACTRSDEHCTRARAELLQLRGCLTERSERVFQKKRL